MAYTPELSQKHSCTLRRVAWALGKPMTKSMEQIFDWIGEAVDSKKICESCRDRTLCHECAFNKDDRIIQQHDPTGTGEALWNS